jgi:hypothetical protein
MGFLWLLGAILGPTWGWVAYLALATWLAARELHHTLTS